MAAQREILFEFLQIGRSVKVTAVDVDTGIEASIVGDPHAGQATLRRVAKQKLDYVMARKKD
jgi:hypothetical protein